MRHTLVLMRHAKSSWSHQVADHDRSLHERGRQAATMMARRIDAAGLQPDLILSSTARRAHETAELVKDSLPSTPTLELMKSLYLPSPEDVREAIACLPDENRCIMVVAHNPGVTESVFEFTRQHEHMPTAAVAVIDFDADSWSDLLVNASGALRCVMRPKDDESVMP